MDVRGKDVDHVRNLRGRLETLALTEATALDWLIPELRQLCSAYGAGAMVTESNGTASILTFGRFVGAVPEKRVRSVVEQCLARMPIWAAYDPRSPPEAQRNRLVVTAAPSSIVAKNGRGAPPGTDLKRCLPAIRGSLDRYYRVIDWDRPTARALVCDGSLLLAYVGITAEKAFTGRQLSRFRALLPALQRRLIAERRLAESSLASVALDAALEKLPAPAFVISGSGRVRHANTAAVALLESDRAATLEELVTSAGPRPDLYDVTRVDAGNEVYYLAVRRMTGGDLPLRVAAAARRWALTPRQTDVLGWLTRGVTNQRIAAELGCAEATVEIHVSRILAKAEALSRAEVVAKVLGGAV